MSVNSFRDGGQQPAIYSSTAEDKEEFIAVLCTELTSLQGGPKKTGPVCYIAYNFRNTAQIYMIFLQKSKSFHS